MTFMTMTAKDDAKHIENANINSIIVQYFSNYEIKKKQLLAKRRIKKGKLLGGGKKSCFHLKMSKKWWNIPQSFIEWEREILVEAN